MRFFPIKTVLICFMFGLFSCQNGEKNKEEDVDIIPAEEKKDELQDQDRPMPRSYMLAKMREDEELSSFIQEIQASGLEEEFEGEEGMYTFFAPSNAAYDMIPAEELKEEDSADVRKRLRDNLKYYMVEGELTVDYLEEEIEASEDGRIEIETALGERLWASRKDGKIILTDVLGNQAAIVTSNMDEYYGVYHILDNVLKPGENAGSR